MSLIALDARIQEQLNSELRIKRELKERHECMLRRQHDALSEEQSSLARYCEAKRGSARLKTEIADLDAAVRHHRKAKSTQYSRVAALQKRCNKEQEKSELESENLSEDLERARTDASTRYAKHRASLQDKLNCLEASVQIDGGMRNAVASLKAKNKILALRLSESNGNVAEYEKSIHEISSLLVATSSKIERERAEQQEITCQIAEQGSKAKMQLQDIRNLQKKLKNLRSMRVRTEMEIEALASSVRPTSVPLHRSRPSPLRSPLQTNGGRLCTHTGFSATSNVCENTNEIVNRCGKEHQTRSNDRAYLTTSSKYLASGGESNHANFSRSARSPNDKDRIALSPKQPIDCYSNVKSEADDDEELLDKMLLPDIDILVEWQQQQQQYQEPEKMQIGASGNVGSIRHQFHPDFTTARDALQLQSK